MINMGSIIKSNAWRRKLSLALLIFAVTTLPSPAKCAEGIDWYIQNRFRAFDYFTTSGHDDSLAESPARRFAAYVFGKYVNQRGNTTIEEVARNVVKLGSPWSDAQRGPWREDSGGTNPRYDSSFVELPPLILVKATLRNASLFAVSKKCQFQTSQATVEAPCNAEVELDVPRTGTTLTVLTDDGTELARQELTPKLKIILGIGDSYGAGEGSPDRPTIWKSLPGRMGWAAVSHQNVDKFVDVPAQWQSDRCNRSFYSYQNLTALTISANDPHSIVSFLHFSCAGAEVIDGLLAPQRQIPGLDKRHCPSNVDPQKRPDLSTYPKPKCDSPKSQLMAVVEALCIDGQAAPVDTANPGLLRDIKQKFENLKYAPKQTSMIRDLLSCPSDKFRATPDQILVSIGGNDMGFVGVVTWGLLPLPRQGDLPGFIKFPANIVEGFGDRLHNPIRRKGHIVCPEGAGSAVCTPLTAEVRIKELPGRIEALTLALDSLLPPHTPVVLNTYPNPLRDSSGELCGDERLHVFNEWYAIHFDFELLHIPLPYVRDSIPLTMVKRDSATIESVVVQKLNRSLIDAARQAGWLVGDAENSFAGGGWCVGTDRVLGNGPQSLAGWSQLDPVTGQSQAYANRGRFIQTINDSFRTQWSLEPLDTGFSGSLHPNPRGYGEMAKAACEVSPGCR